MPRPMAVRLGALVALAAAGACGDTGPPARPWFEDVTAASGVDFVNVCGSPGKEYILDSMGAGVALFDHDGDGDLDLYLVQGSTRERALSGENPHPNRLYRNDGGLRFTDVTAEAGVGHTGWGHGVAAGDVDGDGRLDLYVANWGPDVLYVNEGDGRFRDATAGAGLGDDGWGTSAAFADPDVDGDLDLYVARYVRFDWNRPPPRGEGWKGVPSYAGPQGLTPQADVYHENDGAGRFRDASAERGFHDVPPAYALALLWLDADEDGDVDLYVANDTTPNHLFVNDGGTFVERAAAAGLAYNADGAAQAGMGVACGDADGDGRDDLFVTNFAFDLNTLYRNVGGGYWDAAAARGPLKTASYLPMGWGTAFADLDADADDDLVVVNGHLYPAVDESASLRDVSPYRQRSHLFRNDGGAFEEVGERHAGALATFRCARGLATGDLDDDGDVDLVVTAIDDRPAILRNDRSPGRWLRVVLRQPGGNRFAVGARVTVVAGGRTQSRELRGGGSYLSHSDLRLHFGLGDRTSADVVVRWPDGSITEREGVPADTELRVTKDQP